MGFQSFATGLFTEADLQNLREKSGKPDALLAIGQCLRQARKAAALERGDLAARCGLNADRLGRFEHGASDMDFQSLAKLCDALGMDVAALLGEHMKMRPETVATLINIARSWTSSGKLLSVEDLIAMPDPTDNTAPGKEARA